MNKMEMSVMATVFISLALIVFMPRTIYHDIAVITLVAMSVSATLYVIYKMNKTELNR